MPHVHLTTPTGPIDLHYNISTPAAHSSPTINPQLPCIIFLHAGYIAQEVFERTSNSVDFNDIINTKLQPSSRILSLDDTSI